MSFLKWYNRGEQLYPWRLAGNGQYTMNPGQYILSVNPDVLMMKTVWDRIINKAVREATRLRNYTNYIVSKTLQ